MKSLTKKTWTLMVAVMVLPTVLGFSVIGPFLPWQTAQLGYQATDSKGCPDIGGPMFLNAFYRWNFTNVTYGFDQSFIDYFGTNGMKAVRDAFAVLNNLPAASRMDLNSYPLDCKLLNYQAQLTGLLDLKSYTLALLLEQLGLTDPERYVWSVYYRQAVGAQTNYVVKGMSYDPQTLQASPWVNNVYYTYRIEEAGGTANTIKTPVTFNDQQPFSSVAGGRLGAGYFYNGLTRDDVGGLRFLLHTNTLCVEDISTITGFGTNSPPLDLGFAGWIPWLGSTNVLSNSPPASNYWTSVMSLTNNSNFFPMGVRGGVDKLTFTEVMYDSLLGSAFIPFTNYYKDVVIVSNHMYSQSYSRAVTVPDILFVASHLYQWNVVTDPNGQQVLTPVLMQRTSPLTVVNNDTLNGQTTEGGPGNMTGPVQLTFNTDLGDFLYNSTPYFLNEQWSQLGPRWASFDHTANPPIIYPASAGLTVDQLLAMIEQLTNGLIPKALSPK